MITINQYKKLIEDFFKQHYQINTVVTCNEFDFNADSDIVYPVAHIEYITQNIRTTTITNQFLVTIADLFDPNLPGSELDIYNDTSLIAADCLDYFSNQIEEQYEVHENVSFQKFTNGNVDRVAGCVFSLNFDQFRVADASIIPVESNIDTTVVYTAYFGATTNYSTWADIAALENTSTKEFELNTGLANSFLIAVLNTYSIAQVTDITASNLDLTGLYEAVGSITNNGLTYNLFLMQQALDYTSNHIHKIELQ